MPVTKKKGAIFAIYADSPASSSTLTANVGVRTKMAVTGSPTKKMPSRAPRQALGIVQPSLPRGMPSGPTDKSGKTVLTDKPVSLEKPAKPSTGLEKPAKVGLQRSQSKRSTAKPAPKRQFEVFAPETENRCLAPPATITSDDTEISPAKRNRITPAKSKSKFVIFEDPADAKENDDISGSPATRTRSKTRHQRNQRSISSIGNLTMDSPQSTLRKGRVLMDDIGTTPSKGGRSKGKGLGVTADGPLVDVSEAYGASGDAPEGFATQCR